MKTLKYILYWIGQCTWGCIMTVIGLITVGVLFCLGYKPRTFGPNIYVVVPGNWGGISLGPVFVHGGDAEETDLYYKTRVKPHESGHGLQNLIFGPLFIFLVMIPSPWRCVLRNLEKPTKMRTATMLVSIAAVIIGTVLLAIGAGNNILGLIIAGAILVIYAIIFCLCFCLIEIPKYEHNRWTDYDEVWFEGQATAWGTKVYGHLVE